jgi:uncharacterized membrane protein
MQQQSQTLRRRVVFGFALALLSGCSTVSNVASSSASALSSLNPFSSDKEVSPASDAVPVPVAPQDVIRVEAPQQETVQLAAMPAPEAVPEPAPAPVKKRHVKHKKAPASAPVVAAPAVASAPVVQATVAGNAQCTTFCALPMRKPPAQ